MVAHYQGLLIGLTSTHPSCTQESGLVERPHQVHHVINRVASRLTAKGEVWSNGGTWCWPRPLNRPWQLLPHVTNRKTSPAVHTEATCKDTTLSIADQHDHLHATAWILPGVKSPAVPAHSTACPLCYSFRATTKRCKFSPHPKSSSVVDVAPPPQAARYEILAGMSLAFIHCARSTNRGAA